MIGYKRHVYHNYESVNVRMIPYRAKLSRTKLTNLFKTDEYFARQSLVQTDNQNLFKLLVSLLGSLVLQLKTLLLLLGEVFRRVKVTNFSYCDENFARRILLPKKSFALQGR